jgi:hypothetical protein
MKIHFSTREDVPSPMFNKPLEDAIVPEPEEE